MMADQAIPLDVDEFMRQQTPPSPQPQAATADVDQFMKGVESPPTVERGPTPASLHARMQPGHAGVAAWLQNAADDIRYGTNTTNIGSFLQKLGAPGTSIGAPGETGELVASVPLGGLQAAKGATELVSSPWATGSPEISAVPATPETSAKPGAPATLTPGQQAWQGTKDIAGGLLQASQIPAAFVGPDVAAAAAGKTAQAIIPNAEHAGALFDEVMQAAAKLPVDTSIPGDAVLRAQQLKERGGSLPKVMKDFLSRVTDPGQPQLTYDEARDFYSNATRLSAQQASKIAPVMKRQLETFREALNASLQQTATQAGKGTQYFNAMQEYSRAMKIQNAKNILKKAGIITLGSGVGGAGGHYLWNQYWGSQGRAKGGTVIDGMTPVYRQAILRSLSR